MDSFSYYHLYAGVIRIFSIDVIYKLIILLSFFPIWMSFISFYCLTSLARTFSTMLNTSCKSGDPCLVPDLKGKAFSFLFGCDVECGFLIISLCWVWVCSFITQFWEFLIVKGFWILSSGFSASIKMILRFLSFILLI